MALWVAMDSIISLLSLNMIIQLDVPMEQWALAVVSYSLYTYLIEVESNFKTASRVHVSADCSWSHESDCRQQTHIIVFGCPHDHLVLLELIR